MWFEPGAFSALYSTTVLAHLQQQQSTPICFNFFPLCFILSFDKLTEFPVSLCLPAGAIMSSVLQKLISPQAGSAAEPPRNKVTVVGVGQVGMACAVSILLRVRQTLPSASV